MSREPPRRITGHVLLECVSQWDDDALICCRCLFITGKDNLFSITGRMNCGISLSGQKINEIYLQILPRSS